MPDAMIRLVQYVPLFVNDGEGGWTVEAPDQATLLALPQVAVYANDLGGTFVDHVTSWVDGAEVRTIETHCVPIKRFYRWSLSRHAADRTSPTLMVEHSRGRRWGVVGYIVAGAERLTLPDWTPLPPFLP